MIGPEGGAKQFKASEQQGPRVSLGLGVDKTRAVVGEILCVKNSGELLKHEKQ